MDADVIVIGAGAAGLAAARHLATLSLRVIVLEARDRTGGRVWSQPLAPAAIPAELGAEFIHGRAEETLSLLRDAGVTAINTGDASWTADADGALRRDDDDLRAAAAIFERAHSLETDLSVDSFLQHVAASEAMRNAADMARAFVEGFDAADPAIASAKSIADEWRSGVDSTSGRPLGGYGPVFDHLRDTCAEAGAELRLSTVVRRIAWRRGDVAIDANAVEGARTIRARAAVITLPSGVLRHRGDETAVTFHPELPARKVEALHSIEMGHVVRVVLSFRSAFWEELQDGRYRDGAFFRPRDQPFSAYWTQLPVRTELIVAWVGGPKALALRDASQAERVGLALDGFGSLFGEASLARKDFVGAATHDWDRDPFSRGAYSYILVGGNGARAELAASIDDTLFFAGEATSTDGQGGTVNGALETGARAAREVAAALRTGA